MLDETLTARLDQLRHRAALPAGWTHEPNPLLEGIELGGVHVGLVGLCARRMSGSCEIITGSAAERDEFPVERAYFELFERVSVVEAENDPDRSRAILDAADRTHTSRKARELIPAKSGDFRYARSNGVAAADDWEGAKRSAELELIERDRVLRSWYGLLSPVRQAVPGFFEGWLVGEMEWEVYEFPDEYGLLPANQTPVVVGVFGFPRQERVPIAYGFAADPDWSAALRRAARECAQRLAFLWGEEIPAVVPAPTRTPDYHQEYYLAPESHSRLRGWLAGEHRGALKKSWYSRESCLPSEGATFVDLSPMGPGSPRVVQAIDPRRWPLAFGTQHPCVPKALASLLGPHPIA